MVAATKTKSEKVSDEARAVVVDGFDVAKQLRMLEDCAEKILSETEEGCRFTPEKMSVFGALQWNVHRIRREQRRIAGVREQQAKFGSRRELAEDEAKAEAAVQRELTEGEPLRQQIAEAQAKLDAMAAETKAAQAAVAKRTAALKALRSSGCLPRHLWMRYEQAESLVRRSWSADARTKQQRVRAIDGMLALQADAEIVATVGNSPGCKHFVVTRPGSLPSVNRPAWDAHCQALRAEREQLTAELAEDLPAFEEALADVESIRDLYVTE